MHPRIGDASLGLRCQRHHKTGWACKPLLDSAKIAGVPFVSLGVLCGSLAPHWDRGRLARSLCSSPAGSVVGKRSARNIKDRANRIVRVGRAQEGHHIGHLLRRLEIA